MQLISFQVCLIQFHRADTTVAIGGVVVGALTCIAAGSVLGNFTASVLQTAAASGLVDRIQNVKKLTDALVIAAKGIELREGCPDEPGLGGKIPRQANGPHTPTVGLQIYIL